MKRVLSRVVALCLLICSFALAGCVDEAADKPSGAPEISPSSVVSGAEVTQTDAGGEDAQNQHAPDLSAIPAKKLMQIDFEKVYSFAPEQMDSYYAGTEGPAESFSRADTVPKELTDVVGKALIGGDTDSFIAEHSVGTELDREQIIEKAGGVFDEDGGFGTVRGILADADNDGTDDIIALVFYGGSGGFSALRFYKGANGGYTLTDSLECINYNFAVISFNGRNYICQHALDYNTKYPVGFDIYCCKDGKYADGVSAYRKVGDYNALTVFEDSGYDGIDTVRSTLNNKKMPDILAAHDNVIFGTAEDVIEEYFHFAADIDNDGAKEEYYKKIFYPSNTGTRMVCLWDYIDENGDYTDPNHERDPIQKILDADTGLAETIYTFWVDKVGGDNVLYIYTDSEDRFSLSAYIVR